MFAVPGWSVSADALKAETVAGPNAARQGESKSQKRKRQQQPATDVTNANVAELWDRVIEGNSKKKQKKLNSEKPKQDGQSRSDSNQNGPPADGTLVDDAAPKLSRKEKKLLNKQKAEEEAKAPKDDAATQDQDQETSKRKDKKKKKAQEAGKSDKEFDSRAGKNTAAVQAQPVPTPGPKLTPLQASMREKLVSARFRHLNETLYTKPSADAFQLFQDSPEMFQEYHEGFRRQVGVWPENPVDGYVADILRRARQRAPHKSSSRPDDRARHHQPAGAVVPLPRTNGTCRIADLGCGDAKIATALNAEQKKLRLEMLSYDLQSPSPLVTRADIANLPLEDGSVNVAIFCLALMGTNWLDFVEEAHRILHWKGELWVAEIKSRFGPASPGGKKGGGGSGQVVSHSVGNRRKVGNKKNGKSKKDGEGDEDHATDLAVEVDGADDQRGETDVQAFVEALRKRGFVLQGSPDLGNKMFVRMHFIKAAPASVGKCAAPAVEPSRPAAAADARGPKGRHQKNGAPVRFLDDKKGRGDDEGAAEGASEGRILKPCVYKIR